MPAVGLPTALEGTLGALLKENAVCSWKICAEGTKTTVVLRLVSISDSDRPAMTRHFRRKPPSQLQRDRLRAQERQEKKEKGNQNEPKASQNCSSMSNLSISPRPQMTQQQPLGCNVDTQHSSSDVDTQHSSSNVDTQHSSSDVDTQHSSSDVDTQHSSSNVDTQHSSSDVDTQHSSSDVDTQHSSSDVDTQHSSSDVDTQHSSSDVDTQHSSSDVDTQHSSSNVDTQHSSSDVDTQHSSSDVDTQHSSSDVDTQHSSSDVDTQHSSSDVDTQHSSSNVDTQHSSSDVDTQHSSSDVDTQHSSSDVDTQHSSSDVDTQHSSSDVDTQHSSSDVDTQHSSSDNFARVAGTADKPTERGNNSQGEAGVVLLSTRTAEPGDVFVLTTQSQRGSTETQEISEQRALDFGYNLPSIKKYVSELKDRSAVRSVKNVHRNNSFRRVVRDNTGDRQSLLCETDDFVLIKDCSSDDLPGTYWMIKQATRHMLPEEQGYLDNLRHGSPVDRGKFKDNLRTVLHEVAVLRNVTRFYLG
ncbi:uncharacterized protein [Littorina saxatilis]|uniref:uncharacterized protein n=1 Tax=Littorina saxatilis TaxID=31220 RepID=UPI0038B67B4C